MLRRLFPFLVLLTVLVSCSKDKPSTKPSIKFKSINGTDFLAEMVVNISLEYTDKEGDLGNGIITYIRDRVNLKPITDPASNDKADTIQSALPDFPKTSTGEITLRIPGSFLDEDPLPQNDSANASIYNDTVVFKIFVQDIAGNVSDTITTPEVVQRAF
jgi:hypothetical protein